MRTSAPATGIRLAGLILGTCLAAALSGCGADARGAALESAARAFDDIQERVARDLWQVPQQGFVDFVDGGGLRIGWSTIGDDSIEFAGASESFVTAASETDGIGVVQAVVTGIANVGAGDMYDDAIVYACFEVGIDIAKRSVLEYRNSACPQVVTDGIGGYELVSLDDIS